MHVCGRSGCPGSGVGIRTQDHRLGALGRVCRELRPGWSPRVTSAWGKGSGLEPFITYLLKHNRLPPHSSLKQQAYVIRQFLGQGPRHSRADTSAAQPFTRSCRGAGTAGLDWRSPLPSMAVGGPRNICFRAHLAGHIRFSPFGPGGRAAHDRPAGFPPSRPASVPKTATVLCNLLSEVTSHILPCGIHGKQSLGPVCAQGEGVTHGVNTGGRAFGVISGLPTSLHGACPWRQAAPGAGRGRA